MSNADQTQLFLTILYIRAVRYDSCMDPITHAISGAALARAIPKHHLPAQQLLFIILLTMAPDVDIILRLFSDTLYLQHHRGITHSILLIPLWGWLVYSLSSSRIKQNPSMPWLIGAALLLHISLDIITTFGTMILAPFSDWRASLDLLFIIDPFFTASMLIPLLLGVIWKRQKRKMGLLSLLLMCSYLSLTYSNQQLAIDLARQQQPNAKAYNALPMAFSPYHWQLIAIYPDHYARAAINLKPDFSGSKSLFDKTFVTNLLSTQMHDPDAIVWQTLPAMHTVKHLTSFPGTAFYDWFARYPVLLEQNDKQTTFGDLAFGGGAPGVRPAFQLQINLEDRTEGDISEKQPTHAWLIWRNDHKSKLDPTSPPFSWF